MLFLNRICLTVAHACFSVYFTGAQDEDIGLDFPSVGQDGPRLGQRRDGSALLHVGRETSLYFLGVAVAKIHLQCQNNVYLIFVVF
jgi:hypothetical protein